LSDHDGGRATTHTSAEHGAREKQQIDLLLQFFTTTKDYCVGVVDMVGSTKITMNLPAEKTSRYYSIFLNGLAGVVASFGAIVVKNIGDSLLYYFPATERGGDEEFRNVLKCCYAMAAKNADLDAQMMAEGLPPVQYRISCDYGAVIVAKMSTSSVNDVFGTPVNLCAKMNTLATPGGVVVGQGLYDKVKGFAEYEFTEVEAPIFEGSGYRAYRVTARRP
jgi:class 3 adenylate cyclase